MSDPYSFQRRAGQLGDGVGRVPLMGRAAVRTLADRLAAAGPQDFPAGRLSTDAGVGDLGRRQYGPLGERYIEPSDEELSAMREGNLRRLPVINSMVNPDRFRAAQQSWPESPRAVWSFDDRFRGLEPQMTFDDRFRGHGGPQQQSIKDFIAELQAEGRW